jgi:hypothetical protein
MKDLPKALGQPKTNAPWLAVVWLTGTNLETHAVEHRLKCWLESAEI